LRDLDVDGKTVLNKNFKGTDCEDVN